MTAAGVRYPHATTNTPLHGTTILAVRKGRDVVVIGDGQVSMGGTVFKPNARKVRIIGGGKVICGFAGSTADCFALLDALEKKLEEYPGQLLRAGVELAKMWRTDKFLRHLEVRHSHIWQTRSCGRAIRKLHSALITEPTRLDSTRLDSCDCCCVPGSLSLPMSCCCCWCYSSLLVCAGSAHRCRQGHFDHAER